MGATKFLSGLLIVGMFIPGSVYADAVAKSTVGAVDHAFHKQWNHVAKQWPSIRSGAELDRELKKFNFNFNPRFGSQDERYLTSIASQMPELLKMNLKGDTYEFTQDGKPQVLLTMKVLGDNQFLLNGKTFSYDENSSLEVNLARVRTLIGDEQASRFEQMFLPRADAMPALLIVALLGAAAFVIVKAFQTHGKNLKEAGGHLKNGIKQAGKSVKSLFVGGGDDEHHDDHSDHHDDHN